MEAPFLNEDMKSHDNGKPLRVETVESFLLKLMLYTLNVGTVPQLRINYILLYTAIVTFSTIM